MRIAIIKWEVRAAIRARTFGTEGTDVTLRRRVALEVSVQKPRQCERLAARPAHQWPSAAAAAGGCRRVNRCNGHRRLTRRLFGLRSRGCVHNILIRSLIDVIVAGKLKINYSYVCNQCTVCAKLASARKMGGEHEHLHAFVSPESRLDSKSVARSSRFDDSDSDTDRLELAD